MPQQALVTGGAGFIGSTIVDRLLAEDWKVDVVDDLSSGSLGNLANARALGDRRFSFHRIDVSSPAVVDIITHRRPEVIFHMAAQLDVRVSVARPAFDATINILGSLNICEGAVAAGTRKVVFAGSGGTLYGSPDEIPTREGAPQHPESPYGVAKKAVGDYLAYYRMVRGLDYTVLALANVYGPRQDAHGDAGVIAIYAGKLLTRERPVIFGDGLQTRDFVYVDDVVDAFVRASEKGGGTAPEHRHRHRNDGAAALRRHGQAHGLQRTGPVHAAPHGRRPAQRAGSRPRRDSSRLEAVHRARRGARAHARTLQGPARRGSRPLIPNLRT